MEAGEKETAYIPIRVLGRGAFGEAMLYRKVADNSLVVWKEVTLGKLSEKERKDAQNEIDILSMLNHANIVSYYNHFLDGDSLLIEMEFCNDGSLCEKLAVMKDLLPENEILWYLYQLVSAVAHIHEYNIIHRDIKTMNIFLTKTGLIKLGDFGISRMMSNQTLMAQTYVGTLLYMSPELVKGDPYDYKTDIWAVGCVLYEMLTLTRVFDATNALRLANDIVHGNFDDISPRYSVEIRSLCNILLNKDPSKRPEAEDILKMPLLDNCANEFDGRIWDFNTSARNLKMSASSLAATQVEVMPVITSQSSEVYFWGGGKLTPQKQELFSRGRSALDIAVGGVHFAVATVEKELYTWAGPVGFGSGIVGQLGHGDKAAYKAPKKVEALESVSIKQVSCGDDFTVCVSDSGSVYSFGSDYYGCLGCDNQEGDEVCTPVLIDFFNSKPVDQISCGDAHVVALTKDGEVYTWGCGEYGRLGLGSEDDFAEPQKVHTRGRQSIRSVHAGSDNTFVVKTNGRVLACGSNEHNKLGCNSAAQGLYKRKEQISYDIQCRYNLSTVKPLIKYNVQTVSPGPTHTGAIDSGGHLIIFGSNKYGQLGVGDYKERSGVTLVSGVLGGQKVTKVSCGEGFTVIATADNFVYSWGLSENGRLGTDTADQGKGPDSHCFALPRPIFGALHRVSSINSFRWSTGVIAEKVLSQKTIRSTSTGARVYNNMCSEESQGSVGDSVISGPTCVVEEEEGEEAVNMEESTQMPWLQQELDGEYIAVDHPLPPDVQAPPPVEESVPPPWLKKELDEAEIIPIAPDNCDVNKLCSGDTQGSFMDSTSGSMGKSHDTEVARLAALVSRLEFEVTSLREENKGLRQRNSELSGQVAEQGRGNVKLQNQIEQQAETIMSQAQTIKQLQDKLVSLEQIEADMWRAVDTWTQECMQLKQGNPKTTHIQNTQANHNQNTGTKHTQHTKPSQNMSTSHTQNTKPNRNQNTGTSHTQNTQAIYPETNDIPLAPSKRSKSLPEVVTWTKEHAASRHQNSHPGQRRCKPSQYQNAKSWSLDETKANHKQGYTGGSEGRNDHIKTRKSSLVGESRMKNSKNSLHPKTTHIADVHRNNFGVASKVNHTTSEVTGNNESSQNRDTLSLESKAKRLAKIWDNAISPLGRKDAFRRHSRAGKGEKVDTSGGRGHRPPKGHNGSSDNTAVPRPSGPVGKCNISVKDVVSQGNAIDVLFEQCDNRREAKIRGRLNSADNLYSKSAFTLLKRTRSVPEQMNLQLELGPTRVVERLVVDSVSAGVPDRWSTLKCDMLRKSYTPSAINKTLRDFTTSEQMI